MIAAHYDVITFGGGPAGVTAAVQAARAGARTLLVEKNGMLGGTTTVAGVNFPGLFHAWGKQVIGGIGWEWIERTMALSGDSLPDFSRWREGRHWKMQILVNIPVYAAVADDLVINSGADLLFHTLPAAMKQEGQGWRVTLCSKEGLREVTADVVIDASGDANAVALAGLPLRRNAAMQPGTLVMKATGYDLEALDLDALEAAFVQAVEAKEMRRSDFQASQRPVSAFLVHHGGNSIHLPGIDASTSEGKSRLEREGRAALLRIVRFMRAQPGLENFRVESCAPECGVRETVSIEGDVTLSSNDYVSGRVWADSLCYSFYPIDLHSPDGQGGIDTRYLAEGVFPTIPLAAQLPRGADNLVVAGRAISGDQYASSAYRVQASAMAMGQVAGAAAGLAARTKRTVRELPLAEIREILSQHRAIVPPAPFEGERHSVINSAPQGLMCDLLAHPERTGVRTLEPTFGWIVGGEGSEAAQSAYQIRCGLRPGAFEADPLIWDSGKVVSSRSIAIPYAGSPLCAGQTYWWSVRTWNGRDEASPWATPQAFTPTPERAAQSGETTSSYPVEVVERVGAIVERAPGRWSIDFEQQAFGWVEVEMESKGDAVARLHLGEAQEEGRVHRTPPGSVRYAEAEVALSSGRRWYRVPLVPDLRNTGPEAIPIPECFGVIMPLRYLEVECDTLEAELRGVRLMQLQYPFNESAAQFHSNDEGLNAIWKLCHYTIRATTFAGYYVDGDRERIPYEGDAYINQLSHYAVDREYSLARRTLEYLLEHPTWPTEWRQHFILMAWADFEATGDDRFLTAHYEKLQQLGLLLEYARPDTLLSTGALAASDPARTDVGDLVDWPVIERDDFDFKAVNTVVNAFHYRTLVLMEKIARQLGKGDEADRFAQRARQHAEVFNERLFDPERGLYVDGEGSDHISAHGNLFPLAMGVVPPERQGRVVAYLRERGMVCSVYAAQYLLEGLFEAGAGDAALELMTATGLRSWHNMLRQGATLTWEAWDQSIKPNQDWNHAWATAPINVIARYVLGIRPLEPGYGRILFAPQIGSLQQVSGVVPTIRGPIHVSITRDQQGRLCTELSVPPGVEVVQSGES